MNNFDRIVALVYDKRFKDFTIDLALKEFGMDVETFIAGNGTELPLERYDYIDKKMEGRAQAYNYSECLKKILNKSKMMGHKKVLFLEDDAVINPKYKLSFDVTLEYYLKQLPKEWDMFYLGGNVQNAPSKYISYNIIECNYILDMQATVFNETSFDKILNIDSSNEVTIDGVIAEKQKNGILKAYSCAPVLITQKDNWSYNENKFVSRSRNHIL